MSAAIIFMFLLIQLPDLVLIYQCFNVFLCVRASEMLH